MKREHLYYVYIMQSVSRHVLYGMTNNLHRRVWEHRNHTIEEFSDDNDTGRLVNGRATMMCTMPSIEKNSSSAGEESKKIG